MYLCIYLFFMMPYSKGSVFIQLCQRGMSYVIFIHNVCVCVNSDKFE